MDLSVFLLVAAGTFVLTHFLLLPLAKERWRADPTAASIAKAGTVAGIKVVSSMALLAALAALLTLLFIALFNVTPQALHGTVQIISSVKGELGVWAGRIGLMSFVLVAAAVVYYARRTTRKRMKYAYEEGVQAELERVSREVEDGRLEPLEPTEEMQQLLRQLATVESTASVLLEQSHSGTGSEEQLRQLAELHEEIQERLVQLDLGRRIEPKWDFESVFDDSADGPRWEQIKAVLFSKGAFDTTGDVSRNVGRALTVLLFLSLVGISGSTVLTTMESRALEWTQLAITDSLQEAIREETAAEDRPFDATDQRIADHVAIEFERAFARSLRGGRVAASSETVARELRQLQVRRGILAEAVAGENARPTALSGSLSDADVSPTAREAARAFEEGPSEIPSTASDRAARLRRDIAESGVHRTSGWEKLRAEFRARGVAFRTPVSPFDLGEQMIGKIVGMALGEATPEVGSEAARIALKIQSRFGTAGFQRFYRIKQDQYLADLARGFDLAAAAERVTVGTPATRRAAAPFIRPLAASLADVPVGPDVVEALRHHPVRMAWDHAADSDVALNRARAVRMDAASLAENFATFDAFFPPDARRAADNSRTRTLRRLARGGASIPGLATGAQVTAEAARLAATRATNFRALRGFSRVGGVLIGQPPDFDEPLDFLALGWRLAGDSIEIWLERAHDRVDLGVHPTVTLHQALVYAADERPVAVTMVHVPVPSSPAPLLKVLVHPTLMDTELGRDMVALDRFVDTWTKSDSTSATVAQIQRERERLLAQGFLYDEAWRIRLVTAEMDADSLDPAYTAYQKRPGALTHAQLSYLLEAGAGLNEPTLSSLPVKEDFYDPALVEVMVRCAGPADATSFRSCVSDAWIGVEPRRSWRTPPPDGQVWSGVREEPFTVDPELRFLRAASPHSPLRFILQQAFATPPAFGEYTASEREAYSDPEPWEFPSVATLVHTGTAGWAGSSTEGRRVLREVQGFTYLQRLFRSILEGAMGPDFALDNLVALARDTRGATPFARTARWSPPVEVIVAGLLELILTHPERGQMRGSLSSVPRTAELCLAAIGGGSRESDMEFVDMSLAEWDENCDFSAFEGQAEELCYNGSGGADSQFACYVAATSELGRVRQLHRAMEP